MKREDPGLKVRKFVIHRHVGSFHFKKNKQHILMQEICDHVVCENTLLNPKKAGKKKIQIKQKFKRHNLH